jgi:hypothetical protein
MDMLLVLGCCCCLGLGLVLGWLAGRAAGVEEERGRQIDKLTHVPREPRR